MHVSLAILPPEEIRAELAALVSGVQGVDTEMDPVRAGSIRLRLFGLGNLTRPDVDALCENLARQIAEIGVRPRIRLAGVWALEDPADPSVALHVDGDVDGVVTLFQALPRLVMDHGFYVDRRLFAPRVTVARVTDGTSLTVLQRLVETLEGYRSPEWEVSAVDVVTPARRDESGGFETVHSLATAFGPGDGAARGAVTAW